MTNAGKCKKQNCCKPCFQVHEDEGSPFIILPILFLQPFSLKNQIPGLDRYMSKIMTSMSSECYLRFKKIFKVLMVYKFQWEVRNIRCKIKVVVKDKFVWHLGVRKISQSLQDQMVNPILKKIKIHFNIHQKPKKDISKIAKYVNQEMKNITYMRSKYCTPLTIKLQLQSNSGSITSRHNLILRKTKTHFNI